MTHDHSQLIEQYNKDAEQTEKPWELWEAFTGHEWRLMTGEPSWAKSVQYRRIDYYQKFKEVQSELYQMRLLIDNLAGQIRTTNYALDDLYEQVNES